MTNTENTAEDAQNDAQEPEQVDQAQQDTPEDQEPQDDHERDLVTESRKYRKRAQEAEARVEALTAQLAGYRDAEVDQIVAEPVDVTEAHWSDILTHKSEQGIKEFVDGLVQREGPSARHTARLKHPGDLFTVGGLDKASVIGPDGIDREAIAAAASELYKARPDLFTTKGPVPANPGQPQYGPDTRATWDAVIKGRKQN